MDPLCRFMMEYALPVNFKKEESIKMPGNKEMIYFINKGQAIAYSQSNQFQSWVRLIGPNSFFYDFQIDTEHRFQLLKWEALSPLEILAIPFHALQSNMNNFPNQWGKFISHLHQVDHERIEQMANLTSLKNQEKVDYMENNLPQIFIQTKYEHLAKFLGMSRESLNRIISKKNNCPSIF
ncbi:CRP-like cAMP-binding protein [Cecembia rubra]|uniref:CRP-like cAMP-binding protein n=2 Tax=Cecembia rubra TaxID=1485585 RepID=A0A2P8DVL0_9BACT|nr:CRP-like cAMP-binding protein [Cecembia rubra]